MAVGWLLFFLPLAIEVLLSESLQILPHVRVVFQVFIEGPHDVQASIMFGLDQTSDHLEAALFEGVHCGGRKGTLRAHPTTGAEACALMVPQALQV